MSGDRRESRHLLAELVGTQEAVVGHPPGNGADQHRSDLGSNSLVTMNLPGSSLRVRVVSHQSQHHQRTQPLCLLASQWLGGPTWADNDSKAEATSGIFKMKLSIFLGSDKNFKTFIAHLIFGQIQLPGAVLNAELLQLSKTVLGFKI